MTKLMLVFYTAANQKPFISLPTKTAISEHPPGLIDAVGKQVVTQTLPLIFTFLFQFDTVDGRSAEEGKDCSNSLEGRETSGKTPLVGIPYCFCVWLDLLFHLAFVLRMAAPVKLSCSLARFTASFRSSFFLQAIWRLCGMRTGIVQFLEWSTFFLFARSCIGIFADRGELALAITENRLQLDAPMSSWSVPTPPVQGEQHAEPVYHISDDSSSEGPP